MFRRLRHRVRQFAGALRPRVDPAARDGACALLSHRERALFDAMMPRDQQHGLEVYARVRAEAGPDDADLLVAALLHDCGKGRVALWQRVAHVLVGAVAAGLRARMAAEDGARWRTGMYRLLHHPELGARLAADAGAATDVVRMIRDQDAAKPDRRLALLQAADEA